jgi:Holliday junction resolvase
MTDRTESERQREIMRTLERHGFLVWRMNAGRGRYNQRLAHAGTPDLMAVSPKGRTFWIEVKTPYGALRDAQKDMHEQLIQRGHSVVVASGVHDLGFLHE